MPILETPRLILREFSPTDVDALARVLSDPETMRFYPAPFDRNGVEGWIARNQQRYAEDGHGLWAMVLKTDSQLVGDCGLTLQDVDGARELEIGYHVRRDFCRPGLPRLRVCSPPCRASDFSHPSGKPRFAPRGGKERHDRVEGSGEGRNS